MSRFLGRYLYSSSIRYAPCLAVTYTLALLDMRHVWPRSSVAIGSVPPLLSDLFLLRVCSLLLCAYLY